MPAGKDRPRVLLVAQMPPPKGGIASYACSILESDLSKEFDFDVFDTGVPEWVRSRALVPPMSYRGMLQGDLAGLARLAFWGGVSEADFVRRLLVHRPKIVHILTSSFLSFWRSSSYAALAKPVRARVVMHLLTDFDYFYGASGARSRRWIQRALDVCDSICVQSPGIARRVASLTSKPVHGFFNGIPLARFDCLPGRSDARKELGITGEQVMALMVGSMGRRKGASDLIAAAARVRDVAPRLTYHLAGYGDLSALRQQAAEHGVSAHFRFHGVVSEGLKDQLLAAADVFVLPSYQEGQPIAILEAMAAGLPVIATRVGSIGEVVDDVGGRLVTPGEVTGLADALVWAHGDPLARERAGMHNAEVARNRHDLAGMARAIGGVYSALLQ